MIRITCPICGSRSETEFTYGGDATVARPAQDNDNPADWNAYVFERQNPRGWHKELWHHTQGCRHWLIVERNTLTHEIRNCRQAKDDAEIADTARDVA